MEFKNLSQARKLTGINYLGSVSKTYKHAKSKKYHELTYSLYLAPAKSSGYETCPRRTEECTLLCLNTSGNALRYTDQIVNSRINKTKLFFEHREFFMNWLVYEIKLAHARAKKYGYKFSVRLNNTSDISPESFYMDVNGKKRNILQIFPKIKFYDYTKVSKRAELLDKYKNYDLTFSYSGYNLDESIQMLNRGVRVAVVFRDKLPTTFWGRQVIDGDLYDMRYKDPKNVIVGLKYKTTKNKIPENQKFVV